MAKVVVRADDGLLEGFPGRWGASVSVATRDGRTFEHRVHGTGPEGPPSWDELQAKGERLLARSGGARRVAVLTQVARNAERAGDLGALGSLALVQGAANA
jgi:hypothetical protein